jgi:hypothetical protein
MHKKTKNKIARGDLAEIKNLPCVKNYFVSEGSSGGTRPTDNI